MSLINGHYVNQLDSCSGACRTLQCVPFLGMRHTNRTRRACSGLERRRQLQKPQHIWQVAKLGGMARGLQLDRVDEGGMGRATGFQAMVARQNLTHTQDAWMGNDPSV